MNLSQRIIDTVDRVLLGKDQTVKLAVSCFLAGGHLLLDDIPGVGKTTLALAMARAIGCSFQRVQFTSDLLPSDVLGISIFNQNSQNFDFKPGPVFHNVILADEINRASPKTQSALLESMQENQVSMDNQTHDLPCPFFVIATENPHDHHGTFPLPESQLDRFMMRLNLGYPNQDVEVALLRGGTRAERLNHIEAVTNPSETIEEMNRVRRVKVEETLDRYMIDIAKMTRQSALVELGLSPRGTLALRRAAQAFALADERDYVIPDDIKSVGVAVLSHRMRIHGAAGFNGNSAQSAGAFVSEILGQVPVPS